MTRLLPRRTRLYSMVTIFYMLVAFLSLNMLLLRGTEVVPFGGDTDYYQFHWNFWWVRYALFDLHQSIYWTTYLHVPYELNLAYHTLTLNWFPFYLIARPLLGQILTVNVMLWITLTLNGALTWALLRTERVPNDVALIGGLFPITMQYITFHVWQLHLNIIAFFWVPLTAILWHRIVQTRQVKWALLLGVAFWAMWLNGSQWLIWAPLFLVPYGIMTITRIDGWTGRWQAIGLGLLAVAIMGGLGWGVGPLRQMLAFEGTVAPAELKTPRHWSLTPGGLIGFGGEQDQTLGHILLPLTLIALLVRPRQSHRWRWLWAGSALVILLLAFGPDVTIGGIQVPLPYRWVHAAFNGLYRTPVRFLMMAVLALLLFIGWQMRSWLAALPTGTRRALLLGVVLVVFADGRLYQATPVYEVPHYQFHRTLGDDPTDVVLVNVPLSVANGWNAVGKLRPYEQYYQMIHQKRMVNGSVSREPTSNYLYYEHSPLWKWLAGQGALQEEAARAELHQRMREWPIGYIVIDQSYRGPDHPQTLEWIAFMNSDPHLCFFTREDPLLVYRSTDHPDGCTHGVEPRVDLGTPADLGVVGFGWYWPENFGGRASRWMGQQATLHLKPPAGADTLIFHATAFQQARQVTIIVNGDAVQTVEIAAAGWERFSMPLPAAGSPARITLTFTADSAISPAELGLSADERLLSIAISDVSFE